MKNTILLFLASILVFPLVGVGQTNIVPDHVEKAALLALYNETDGVNWTNIQWELEDINNYPSTTLAGVTVRDGDITSISINNSNLTGKLPSQLNDLAELEYLSLQGNSLSDILPDLGNLEKLETFNLNNNSFSGAFPEWICDLTNLKVLHLSNSGLSGPIPDKIDQLAQLQTLYLSNNDLSMAGAIPEEFAQLDNLQTLDLQNCKLQPTSVTVGLSGLSNLYSLNLSNNPTLISTGDFTNLLTNMPNLQRLFLRNNNIQKLSGDLTNLPLINYLDLSNNNFSDIMRLAEIVDSIKSITSLKTLLLMNCNINALPLAVQDLMSVEALYLNNNLLDPGQCEVLGEMAALKNLYISACNLSTLPQNLINSNTLQVLNAANNNLSIVPEMIKDIPNLEDLDLTNNGITNLPSWFGTGNMGSLRRLVLNNNGLTALPENFSLLTNLTYLSIGNNNLTGVWPSNFSALNNMQTLYLNNNEIEVLPDLTSWSSLRYVYVQNNQLTGTVPEFLTNVTSQKSGVNLSFNDYTDVPNNAHFSGNNVSVSIQGNQFTFEHVLQLKPSLGGYTYTPQDSVDNQRDVTAFPGGTLTLEAHIDTATTLDSKFQWFKYVDGTNDIPLFPTPTHEAYKYSFTINDNDQGSKYYYKITNSAAPALTLKSRLITLTITCDILPIKVDFYSKTYLCATNFVPDIIYPEGCRTKSYSWDFGGGNTSLDKSPLYAFGSNGTYEVKMNIQYTCGVCISDTTVTKTIQFVSYDPIFTDSLIKVPTEIKSQVISTTVATFSDAWPLESSAFNLSGDPYGIGSKGVWRNNASYVYNVPRNSSPTINLAKDGTFDLEHFNWQYEAVEAIPNWIKINEMTRYSAYSYELENRDVLGNFSSALYDYEGQLPSANGTNMHHKEMAFSSFETENLASTGNWILDNGHVPDFFTYKVYSANNHMAIVEASMAQLENVTEVDVTSRGILTFFRYKDNFIKDNGIVCMQVYPENPEWTMIVLRKSPFPSLWEGSIRVKNQIIATTAPDIDSLIAHSGKKSLKITQNKSFDQSLLSLNTGKKYLISAWVSVNDQHLMTPKLADNIGIALAFKNQQGAVLMSTAFEPAGSIVEGWQQLNGEFTYPDGATLMEITFKPGSKGTAWYDDLRLHPIDGNMQAYVYDVNNLRLTAILDENNYASFYYYDEEGNLYLTKKETTEGIKTLTETISYIKEVE